MEQQMAQHTEEMTGDGPAAPAALLELAIAERSDAGCVRSHNEDYVEHRIPVENRVRARKGILCLVADGMGGHKAGEVASQQAVELIMRHYYGNLSRDVGASLLRALRAANSAIHELAAADPSRAGMGTTLVGLVISGNEVVVANVGDSRAYLVGRKGITRITEDHSWVEEQVQAGMLTPEQARTHPQRNLVTRALGSRPSVEVDLYEGVIADGDILVLCTDGLTNLVEDREIESAVRANSPEDAALLLVELAKERGGPDNVTILVVLASQRQVTAEMPRERRVGALKWALLLLALAVVFGVLALVLLWHAF
jgi:serine/threonine protein phosphatase PrpC